MSGIIKLDSQKGRQLGFTSDVFGSSYLWEFGDQELWISVINVQEAYRGKGYFKELIAKAFHFYKEVAVPNPLPKMERILEKWGFTPYEEFARELGENIIVWRKKHHEF